MCPVLIEVSAPPPNHRVILVGPRCSTIQPRSLVRDGVLLCQLLNNLTPHAVNLREINLRPQMSQFFYRLAHFLIFNLSSFHGFFTVPFSHWISGGFKKSGETRKQQQKYDQ
uniref:Uncharacterized protein n=1 Tax=Sphaerodactylus townsendi TaxID=933632 RepID=A0ACB8EMV6_9SAUR